MFYLRMIRRLVPPVIAETVAFNGAGGLREADIAVTNITRSPKAPQGLPMHNWFIMLVK